MLGPADLTGPPGLGRQGQTDGDLPNVRAALTDCLDVCKFSTFASLDDFAAQYSTFTGEEVTAGDLLKVGEQVYSLERYYNNQAGIAEGATLA